MALRRTGAAPAQSRRRPAARGFRHPRVFLRSDTLRRGDAARVRERVGEPGDPCAARRAVRAAEPVQALSSATGGRAVGRSGGQLPREGQTLVGDSLLVRYVNFVRLPHTIFALPFALLGVVAASFRYPISLRQVALVVAAFTAARFVAMGFNRIADRELDARNPRTRTRELPAGGASPAPAGVPPDVRAGAVLGGGWG